MRADDPTDVAATLTSAFATAVTPEPPDSWHGRTEVVPAGLRPTVPTQGSSLTARSGHGRPQPPTATTEEST